MEPLYKTQENTWFNIIFIPLSGCNLCQTTFISFLWNNGHNLKTEGHYNANKLIQVKNRVKGNLAMEKGRTTIC